MSETNNSHTRKAGSSPEPEPFGGSLFRSVSMAPATHSPAFGAAPVLHGMPPHAKTAPGTLQRSSGPASKATPPPMIKPVARSTLARASAAPVPSVLSTTQATPYEWKLDAMPPVVPMYHPVDLRTSLQLENGAKSLDAVHVTTTRLSKFLHRHSIHTQYSTKDNNDNPFEDDLVRVSCVTPSMNHFCVQLWTLSESPSTLVVEMQRRQGCCMEHQRIRKALYRLLQAEEDEEEQIMASPAPSANAQDPLLNKVYNDAAKSAKAMPGKLPPPLPRSFAFGKKTPPVPKGMKFAGMKPQRTPEEDNARALDMCRNLLTANNRRDQHELGLESLVSLCDSQKVSAALVDKACRAVLCPAAGDSAIQDALMQYCRNNECPGDSKDGETKEDMDLDDMGWYGGYAEGRHFRTMHVLALRILSHSLGALASENIALDPSFVSDVAAACTYNMQVAKQRPLEAELSARCIRLLLQRSNGPSALVPPPSCVMDAHAHGQTFHAGLHYESGLLMQMQGTHQ